MHVTPSSGAPATSQTRERTLVTGATGFIGGRAVEALCATGTPVRALVRHAAGAARIARWPIEVADGAVDDAEAIDAAVRGCDVVLHCAHDLGSRAANLAGVHALGEACLRHGVRRVVHLSSISVYEPLPDGPLDESAPCSDCGWEYPDAKRATERAVLALHRERGLPAVILQPTIVYGPYGGAWTIGPIRQMLRGRILLPSPGDGLCNPVYVDDVVGAMLLAAEKSEAVGERLLISGPETVTWRSFFASYERMLGKRGTLLVPPRLLEVVARALATIKGPLKRAKPGIKAVVRRAPKDRLATLLKSRRGLYFLGALRRGLPPIPAVPGPQQVALYRSRAEVSIARARAVLGYEPRVGLGEGMRRTGAFVAWAGWGRA